MLNRKASRDLPPFIVPPPELEFGDFRFLYVILRELRLSQEILTPAN